MGLSLDQGTTTLRIAHSGCVTRITIQGSTQTDWQRFLSSSHCLLRSYPESPMPRSTWVKRTSVAGPSSTRFYGLRTRLAKHFTTFTLMNCVAIHDDVVSDPDGEAMPKIADIWAKTREALMEDGDTEPWHPEEPDSEDKHKRPWD